MDYKSYLSKKLMMYILISIIVFIFGVYFTFFIYGNEMSHVRDQQIIETMESELDNKIKFQTGYFNAVIAKKYAQTNSYEAIGENLQEDIVDIYRCDFIGDCMEAVEGESKQYSIYSCTSLALTTDKIKDITTIMATKEKQLVYAEPTNDLLVYKQKENIQAKDYFIYTIEIKKLGIPSIVLIEGNGLEQKFDKIANYKKQFMLGIQLLLLLIFIISMISHYYGTKKIANTILEPINELTNVIAASEDIDSLKVYTSNINEIDNLHKKFLELIGIIQDKTEKISEIEKENKYNEIKLNILREYSYNDVLTKLFNRRKIEELMDREIARAKRYANSFSIILIDIDYFKTINDTYGHDIGDEILIELGKILQENVRESDLVGRWGGEEFIVICPETTAQQCEVVAEHLRVTVENWEFTNQIKMTVSIGVAEYAKTDDKYSLFKKADEALYCAKQNGRNNTCNLT